MAKYLFALSLLLSCVVTLSCVRRGAAPSVGKSAGGSLASAETPAALSTVAISHDIESYRKARRGICSATVIAPRVLLTAGHCATVGPNNEKAKHAFFGFDVSDARGSMREIDRIEVHPEFKTQHNHDIALLRLVEDIPPPYRPLRMVEKIAHGRPVLTLGYGRTAFGDLPSSGILRFLEGEATRFDDGVRLRQLQRFPNAGADLIAVRFPSNKGSCPGDSGGPLLVREGAEFVQVGIASFLAHPQSGDTSNLCVDGTAFYTPLAEYSGWIMETLRTLR